MTGILDHSASCAITGNALVLFLAVPIGALIGLVGVGGVLLVPMLAALGGCSERDSIGLSLASFVALGAVSLFVHGRRTGTLTRAEAMLFAAMVPGAIAGALFVDRLPESALAFIVAAAVTCTGAWALRAPPPGSATNNRPAGATLIAIGGITGAASALSGTGGPLVLMPLLLVRGIAIADALGLSRIAQLPIALSATLTRTAGSGVNLFSAAVLGVALMAGMLAGTRLAHRMHSQRLFATVGWALLGTGLGLGALAIERAVR